VRLFDIDAPSAASYYFVCPPSLIATARVQAFHTWIYEEVERFRALYVKACRGAAGAQAADSALISPATG
jgi:LysR family transcriptional regulator, glycine cleavage system transcriptional activator